MREGSSPASARASTELAEIPGLSALREASALVYVDDLTAPRMSEDDAHHIRAVRRLRPGEPVVACDGLGSWRQCRLDGSGGLEPDGEVTREAEPLPHLAVAFSLAKQDRTEWAAGKLAELGVDLIVPLICERTVVRPDEGGGRRQARLERIVRESAMQARLVRLPRLLPPAPFGDLMREHRSGAYALAEPGAAPLTLATPLVLVGPEGGWSEREREQARKEGAPFVGLASSVLRVETAAVAAGVVLAALRAGLVAPAGEPPAGEG